MKTLIRESASGVLGPNVTSNGSRSGGEPGALVTPGEVSAFHALTWLTVGLGVLVAGLAVLLTALAVIQ